MINEYKKKNFISVLDYIFNHFDREFYLKNEKGFPVIVSTKETILELLKKSNKTYILEEAGIVLGLIVVIKQIDLTGSKYFVKLSAISESAADKLLSILLWNNSREFYVEIKKYSKFLKIFYNKGFSFVGFKDKEILLKINNIKKPNDNYHSKDKISNSRSSY